METEPECIYPLDHDMLIIEDSPASAIYLEDLLRNLGYQNIHICNDGKTGLKKFMQLSGLKKLPLVFLDYYLPDIDAISVFDQIQKIQIETKIIIVTVAEKEEDGIAYLTSHGAYHYLQKPLNIEEFKEVMETFEKEQTIFTEK